MTTRESLLSLARSAGHDPLDLSLGIAHEESRLPSLDAAPPTPSRYPPSAGTHALRAAASSYLLGAFGVTLEVTQVGACLGTKEFIASAANHLGRADERRDIVLVPAVAYPTYRVGARLAGCTPWEVPVDAQFRLQLNAVPAGVAERARLLWVNSPANPTGVLEPLGAFAEWGRRHGVPVFSDEAYVETSWATPARSILQSGTDGVVAVHSLSKRSDAPGLRVGFYAGDAGIVDRLVRSRRDAGIMVPAPAQAVAATLLGDDGRAASHRDRCLRRLTRLVEVLNEHGLDCALPEGGPFVWLRAPSGDGDRLACQLAQGLGIVAMPGSAYGDSGSGHVRLAAACDPTQLDQRFRTSTPLAGKALT